MNSSEVIIKKNAEIEKLRDEVKTWKCATLSTFIISVIFLLVKG